MTRRNGPVSAVTKSSAWDGTSITLYLMVWLSSCGSLDESFTLDREPFPAATNVLGCSVVGFLAGLILGAPLTSATIDAMVGGAGSVAVLASVGIDEDFVRRDELLSLVQLYRALRGAVGKEIRMT